MNIELPKSTFRATKLEFWVLLLEEKVPKADEVKK